MQNKQIAIQVQRYMAGFYLWNHSMLYETRFRAFNTAMQTRNPWGGGPAHFGNHCSKVKHRFFKEHLFPPPPPTFQPFSTSPNFSMQTANANDFQKLWNLSLLKSCINMHFKNLSNASKNKNALSVLEIWSVLLSGHHLVWYTRTTQYDFVDLLMATNGKKLTNGN